MMSAKTKILECPFCLTEYPAQDECPECQPDPMPDFHIDYLLDCEKLHQDLFFMWGRTGKNQDVIWISTYGYEHRMMWKIEEILIKRYKLNYAFEHMREHNMFGMHQFDKTSGRTFVYLRERS